MSRDGSGSGVAQNFHNTVLVGHLYRDPPVLETMMIHTLLLLLTLVDEIHVHSVELTHHLGVVNDLFIFVLNSPQSHLGLEEESPRATISGPWACAASSPAPSCPHALLLLQLLLALMPRHVDRHRHTHDERHRRGTSRWVPRYNPSLSAFMTIGRLSLALAETTRPSRHLFSVFYDYPSAEIRIRRFNPFFTSSIFRLFDSPRLTHIHPWSFRLRVSWGVPRLRHTCLVVLKG